MSGPQTYIPGRMPEPGRRPYLREMIRPISRVALILDIVGAALGLLLTLPTSMVMLGSGAISSFLGGADALGYAGSALVGVILWGAAAITRLSPPLAIIVAWVGAALQMGLGFWPSAIDIPILFVLYGTAAWGSRLVMWIGGASTAVGGIVAGIYIAIISSSGIAQNEFTQSVGVSVLFAIIAILVLAISWGAGLLWRMVLRSRRIRSEQLRAEERTVEEQERVRIARDMHDVVAHSLAVVIAQADGARYAASADPEATKEALTTIGQTARGALSDVRMLLTQLRHRQGEGPQPTLDDLETLFAQVRQAGVEPRVTMAPLPVREPPAAIQLAVYRILQEALTNAIRHGEGDVDVQLAWFPDRVNIGVRNAVSSAPPTKPIPSGGHGLVGMRERAQLVGGILEAGRAGAVFVVRGSLPLSPQNGDVS